MIRLERPNIEFKETFLNAVKEVQDFFEKNKSTDWYKEFNLEELENNFEDFVEKKLANERGERLPEGYVPCSEFWIINDFNEYVGRISLRHELSDFLRKWGGHIGYDIIPSARKRGFADKALALCLNEARKLGLDKVLLTCDTDNLASEKVIKNNGGIFQKEVQTEFVKIPTKHYHIKIPN